jgi:hypothetical protein
MKPMTTRPQRLLPNPSGGEVDGDLLRQNRGEVEGLRARVPGEII